MRDPMRTSNRSIQSSVEADFAKSPIKFVIVVGASVPFSLAGFVTFTATSRKVDLMADVLEVRDKTINILEGLFFVHHRKHKPSVFQGL